MRIVSCLFLGTLLLAACDTGTGSTASGGMSTSGGMTGGSGTSTAGAIPPAPITTIAGKGSNGEGFAGGDAGTAEFNMPGGIAVTDGGIIYVADTGNNAIRKIDAQGNVSTVAGLGFAMPGFVDGTPRTALFNGPTGVAVDAAGNIYVADHGNSAVRKIDSHGNVSTFLQAQTGSFIASGPDAGVRYPYGVAVDAAGNVYVSDSGNNAIRKIDTSGNVTTLAGGVGHALGFVNGDAGTAELQPPCGLAVDASGNIYFAEQENNDVRKVDTQGNVSSVAGLGPTKYGFVDGAAATAELFQPFDVALDAVGNVYVADQRNNAVRKIDSQGNVTTIAGRGPGKPGFVNGDAGTAEFDYPAGLAVYSNGNIFVADEMNNAIREIAPQ
jgi:sugar lactone lactonase YvrE